MSESPSAAPAALVTNAETPAPSSAWRSFVISPVPMGMSAAAASRIAWSPVDEGRGASSPEVSMCQIPRYVWKSLFVSGRVAQFCKTRASTKTFRT